MREYVKIAREWVIPNLPPALKTWLADRYHGKVLTYEAPREFLSWPKDIDLNHLPDQVIPYEYARDIIVKTPQEIAVIDCACREAAGNNCQPTQVCMIIGQPFVDFVMAKQPEAKRLTTQEALDLIEEQHKLGRVQTAWFKDACMGRFYAMCNCCKCCCSGVKAMNEWHASVLAPSGYVAVSNPDLCNGCGKCVDHCIYSAIEVMHGKAHLHYDKCLGCGLCADICPTGSWTLKRDTRKGLPLRLKEVIADHLLVKGIGPHPRALEQIQRRMRLL